MSAAFASKPMPCNSELLSRYLETSLAPEEQCAVESHLNECSACRRTLESMAADEAFWTAATEALDSPKGVPLSRPISELSLEVLASVPFGEDTLASELLSSDMPTETTISQAQMLQRWLDPSEKEDSLGRIGKYEVFGVVGQGGMGLVLKALDTELERMVALKTLAHHVTSQADARLRLAREARAAAGMRHPNIVPIFGLENWRDVPLIVMPLVEGGTLQQYASEQRLTTEQVLAIAIQIAEALAALHRAGIVHRDLKPSNILLQDGLDHVLLSDFGLARLDGDLAITHSDALAGTPFFMSPEQALGKSIEVRSDLFSFGSVLYWLCAGKYPFRGNSNYETLSKLVHTEPDFGELVRMQVPSYLQRLIEGLLVKQPHGRWSSADQVVELLRGSLAHFRSPAERMPSALVTKRPANRLAFRWPLRVAVALIGLTVIAFGVRNFVKSSDGTSLALKGDQEAIKIEAAEQQSIRAPRYGALDELDRQAMLADFERGEKLQYWLKRLAFLQVDEIPPEAIPAVQLLCKHSELEIRELAQVIINKNPFQEVLILQQPNTPTTETENPFKEVLPNE